MRLISLVRTQVISGVASLSRCQRGPRSEDEAPFAAEDHGVGLAVRLTTRAGRNALDGVVRVNDGRPALQVRVTAPPVEGAANQAPTEFLADLLELRKADISILSGATARLKMLHLSGEGAVLTARLAKWIGTGKAALSRP